ncbi:spore protease YyaC [Virgibacillus proomii]|uniref:spore protease YyaC n=1 Tax=Virgibacillus proomii TaxID=84407 RepID=UPI001C103C09|nr:spore protease YyaC [Virgibacillus proomii]MBU5268191.1 spore protease YyaC [Virgibacillus proomii]
MNLKNTFDNRKKNYRMHHSDPKLIPFMLEHMISWMPQVPREYIVLSIGTDRSTGDSLGPLVGSFIAEKKLKHISIYGTLDNPVHATNLTEYINSIEATYHHPFIIAIDACLGKATSVGQIIAGKGAIKPGAALNKLLPPIGDIHITGVVNISGFMEYSVLQNTRLNLVMAMARSIAELLNELDQRLTFRKTSPAIITQGSNSSII